MMLLSDGMTDLLTPATVSKLKRLSDVESVIKCMFDVCKPAAYVDDASCIVCTFYQKASVL